MARDRIVALSPATSTFGAALLTNALCEELRSRRINATMMGPDLPHPVAGRSGNEMQMQMGNRLLCNLPRRTDQIHSGWLQRSHNCVSHYECRARQFSGGGLVGVPQICDMNSRDDQRMARRGGVEGEKGDPRGPFANHLSRWILAPSNGAKGAFVGRNGPIADRLHGSFALSILIEINRKAQNGA